MPSQTRDSYDAHSSCCSAFYWGRSAAELPAHVVFGACAGIITYFMFGLRPGAENIGLYVLVMTLTTVCGATLMLLVGAREYPDAPPSFICTPLLTSSCLLQLARTWPWEMD